METPKKKPKFKRRLEFSASDYKSKKKIRVKSELNISVTPVNAKHTSSSEDQVTSGEEVIINLLILRTDLLTIFITLVRRC